MGLEVVRGERIYLCFIPRLLEPSGASPLRRLNMRCGAQLSNLHVGLLRREVSCADFIFFS